MSHTRILTTTRNLFSQLTWNHQWWRWLLQSFPLWQYHAFAFLSWQNHISTTKWLFIITVSQFLFCLRYSHCHSFWILGIHRNVGFSKKWWIAWKILFINFFQLFQFVSKCFLGHQSGNVFNFLIFSCDLTEFFYECSLVLSV